MDFQTYIHDSQTRKQKIQCKPELIINSLQKFYSECSTITKIIPFLDGSSQTSLRVIDWFVTKYSRKNCIKYNLNGKEFQIYLNYKSQLKAYSKQYFDPNCRRERIRFIIPGVDTPFLTTIGKLKFFSWALENGVVDYIEKNIDTIKEEYNKYLKEVSQLYKKNKTATSQSSESSISSSGSSVTNTSSFSSGSENTLRKTRRRMKQIPSSLRNLQITATQVELGFD